MGGGGVKGNGVTWGRVGGHVACSMKIMLHVTCPFECPACKVGAKIRVSYWVLKHIQFLHHDFEEV